MISDADALKDSQGTGIYHYYNPDNPIGGYSSGILVNYVGNYIQVSGQKKQIFYPHYNGNGHLERRFGASSVWEPWEWVNPPMIPGVEYRTTERYLGKPVYTKEYDCGTFPQVNTEKYVALSIDNLQYVVRYLANCRSKSLPHYYGNSTSIAECVDVIGSDSGIPKIRLHSGTGSSTLDNAYVTVFYTKTTD